MPFSILYRQISASDWGETEVSLIFAGSAGSNAAAEAERGVAHRDKASAMDRTDFLSFTDKFSFLVIYFYPMGIIFKAGHSVYMNIIDI